ncbi:Binding-protein-dependent transport systems inner membrane component [Mesorhizobium loti]|nr:Binding-protein-dependent transport systems inner membrane component [Mesorhizobium loti]
MGYRAFHSRLLVGAVFGLNGARQQIMSSQKALAVLLWRFWQHDMIGSLLMAVLGAFLLLR